MSDDEEATTAYRGCPPESALEALAWGGTAAEPVIARHLERCALCRAVVARLSKTEPNSAHHGPLLAEGTMIGRYQIETCLGAGGMGIVYRAIDTELRRPVALKLVRAESSQIGDLTERLLRESRLQARAAHRSVITVYDIGRAGDQVYVAMELIRGTTLREWLAAKPRDWRQLLDVFREAAGGLAAAHAAGLVHRDFKPDNVLVELAGGAVSRVLVTDFGVARAVEVAAVEQPTAPRGRSPRSGAVAAGRAAIEATATGVLLGTPAYMSPEQLASASRVDARSDIFSFCVALWEAIYGARPFAGETVVEIIAALTTPTVPEPPKASAVPRWVCDVLRTGLVFEPDQRANSIAMLSAALDWRTRRSRRLAVVVGGLAAVTGGLVIALAVKPRTDAEPVAHSACEGLGPVAALTAAASRFDGPAYLRRGVADYAREWTRLRAQTCDAQVSEPQIACLDASASELATTLDGAAALEPVRRQDLLRRLVPVVPTECTSSAATAIATVRGQTGVQLAITEAEGALVVDGRRGAARVADARKLARLPAIADEIDFVAAVAAHRQGTGTLQRIRELVNAADRDGHPLLASRAALVVLRAELDAREASAGEAIAVADAAVTRAGNPPRDRAHWYFMHAWVLGGEAGLAEVHRAEQLLASVHATFDIELETLRAVAYLRSGKTEVARAILDDALAVVDGSSDEIELRNELALALLVESPDNVDRATAVVAPLVAKLDPAAKLTEPLVETILVLVNARMLAGDDKGAVALLEKWQAAIDATIEHSSLQAVRVANARANTLAAVGRLADAEVASRAELEITIANVGVLHRETAATRITHGRLLFELGRFEAAREELERGVGELAKLDAGDVVLPVGRLTLAQTFLKLGRPDDAVPHAEAVLAELTSTKRSPAALAETRFVLAQAIAGKDRARAVELLDAALTIWGDDEGNRDNIAAARALREQLAK